MAPITDGNIVSIFAKERTEAHNRALKAIAELTDISAELSYFHRQFLKLVPDTVIKKFADDEVLFETIETYKKDQRHQNESSQQKQHSITKISSEIYQKEMQKMTLMQEIEKSQEERNKTKKLLESQHKENKDKLKKLQKARGTFEDNLKMAIRKIDADKLQFVFQSIDPADQNSPYTITMQFTKDGSYHTVSSKPLLECLPELMGKLQETKKISVFLKNVRKQFISHASQQGTQKRGKAIIP
ncbi:kinetochore protein Spc25 [Syngnathus scovelli]|uniref:kinetochore protein Spc25 n=1 Tax=Syngnathus scovelli TaxID=161590 RepID=UPI0021106CB4|nr:kinetochore protein Spc25 [Syngnathus scovelli]